MFPVYFPAVSGLDQEIQRLEGDHDLIFHLLQIMATQLRQAVGERSFSRELQKFLDATTPAALSEMEKRVRELLQSDETTCVRGLRHLLGMTWDQVSTLRRRWPSLKAQDRVRLMRRAALHRLCGKSQSSRNTTDAPSDSDPGSDPLR